MNHACLVLQLNSPDLAMTAPGAGWLDNFRRQMELNVEALNYALRVEDGDHAEQVWRNPPLRPVP